MNLQAMCGRFRREIMEKGLEHNLLDFAYSYCNTMRGTGRRKDENAEGESGMMALKWEIEVKDDQHKQFAIWKGEWVSGALLILGFFPFRFCFLREVPFWISMNPATNS